MKKELANPNNPKVKLAALKMCNSLLGCYFDDEDRNCHACARFSGAKTQDEATRNKASCEKVIQGKHTKDQCTWVEATHSCVAACADYAQDECMDQQETCKWHEKKHMCIGREINLSIKDNMPC